MVSNRFVCLAVWGLATLGLAAAARADVTIRLVDSDFGAPLEYWINKKLPLPGGASIEYLGPTVIQIDGKKLSFDHYANNGATGSGAPAAGAVTEFMDDMGVGGGKVPEINSDRKSEVLDNGLRLQVHSPLDAGEHTLEPGGVRIALGPHEAFQEADPGVSLAGSNVVLIKCYPVDVNVVPDSGLGSKAACDIHVTSAGQDVIFGHMDLQGPRAVRMFLPASKKGYQVEVTGQAKFSFTLDEKGVKIEGSPTVASGTQLSVTGSTIGLGQILAPTPVPAIPTASSPRLSIFTDRRRSTFAEGEEIDVSVRAMGLGADAPADARQAEIVLQRGDVETSLGRVALQVAGGVGSAEIRIPTALLAPGEYDLSVRLGETASNELPLSITPLLPQTNQHLFAVNQWGPADFSDSAVDLVGRVGINTLGLGMLDNGGTSAFCRGLSPFEAINNQEYSHFDAARHKNSQKKSKKATPRSADDALLELTEPQRFHTHALERMLGLGIGFIPNLGGSFQILYFNAGESWLDQAEDRYQGTQHFGMEVRRFPNILGEVYCSGDGPTPATVGSVFASAGIANFDVIHKQRLDKLKEIFTAKFGGAKWDAADPEDINKPTEKDKAAQGEHGAAWGFHVGEEIAGPRLQGSDERAVAWTQWVNDIYPSVFRNHKQVLSAMMRNPLLICGISWGIGAESGMYPGTFYHDQDYALNNTHGDYGVVNFAYITITDILNMGLSEKPPRPWIGVDMIGHREPNSGYVQLLECLSRTPSGIGVLNLNTDARNIVCEWASKKDRVEHLVRFFDIAKRFGELAMNLDRRDEIGVVSSFRQEALGKQPFRALWAAHYLTQKAGFQANVVSDAFCEAHPDQLAKRFKAIFLYQMDVAPSPAFKAGLEAFQKQGGVIIVDQKCDLRKLGIQNAVALPFTVPDDHGPSNQNDHLEIERFFEPLEEQFAKTVAPAVKPYFTSTSKYVTGIRTTDADLEYIIVFNDRKPQIDDGCGAQFLYAPEKATLLIGARGVLYDALRRTAVPTRDQGDRSLAFDADMTEFPGSIYLLSPRPVASLRVSVVGRPAPGQTVVLNTDVLDDKGAAFSGRLPLEYVVTDPAGAERYRLYRNSRTPVTLKIAGNDPAGEWKIQVADQATGLVASAGFSVAGPPSIPAVARLDTPIFDAGSVYSLIRHKRVEIPIFPSGLAMLPQARRLEEQLRSAGVDASVRMMWPSMTRNYQMQWAYETIEDVEVRKAVLRGEWMGLRVPGKNQNGTWFNDQIKFMTAFYQYYVGSAPVVYYKDVILLGRADLPTDPFTQVIDNARMLPRNLSPNYPAPGQGFIGYAFGPLQARHDAIVLHARDEAGLDKSIDALVNLARQASPPPASFLESLPRNRIEEGESYNTLMGLAPSAAGGPAASITGDQRVAISLLPPRYPQSIAGTVVDPKLGVVAAIDNVVESKPDAVVFDLATKQNASYTLEPRKKTGHPEVTINGPDLALFLSNRQNDPKAPWPVPYIQRTSRGIYAPVEQSAALLDPKTLLPAWTFEPFPAFRTFEEVKYPRLAYCIKPSENGKWVLASFYDRTPGGDFDVQMLSRPDVELLDGATGKRVTTIQNLAGTNLAIDDEASRLIVIDAADTHSRPDNAFNSSVIAAFNQRGKELWHLPITPPIEQFHVDSQARMALIRYKDARMSVTVIDLESGKAVEFKDSHVDIGASIAPDGSYGVLGLSDGRLIALNRDGSVRWKVTLPAPAQPAISPDGKTLYAAGFDGSLYRIDAASPAEPLKIADLMTGSPVKIDAKADDALSSFHRPQTPPLWDRIKGKDVAFKSVEGAPFAASTPITGSLAISPALPSVDGDNVALLSFMYQLDKPGDELRATFEAEGREVTMRFGWHPLPWRATLALRPRNGGPLPIKLACSGTGTLSDGVIKRMDLGSLNNGALTSASGASGGGGGAGAGTNSGKAGKNHSIRVNVPASIGLLGDPRTLEQMAYGISPELSSKIHVPVTNPFEVADGKLFSGTALYPSHHRAGFLQFFKDPIQNAKGPLRSASVVFEMERPYTFRALAIWEDPADLPASSYTLECCSKFKVDNLTKQQVGDWKLVASGRFNTDYFHFDTFAPVEGKIWRYTIVDSPAAMQHLAEIELYEEGVDQIMDVNP